MASLTLVENGKLTYGLTIDGVRHTDFELRLPTMEDMEHALESVPAEASLARVRRHVWARCLTSLGTLTGDDITPELLGGLSADEYIHFDTAEANLKKKLLTGNGA